MMGVFDVAPPRRHVIAKAPESTEVQLFWFSHYHHCPWWLTGHQVRFC
jgi:hypothetical protein